MGALMLLALVTGALSFGMLDDGENGGDTVPPQDEPDAPDTPTDPGDQDTGAAFDFDAAADEVMIDVGADETRNVASVIYVNSEDSPGDFYRTYEARFYLVPEGVDLSDNDFEDRWDIPGQQNFGGDPYDYQLADFENHFGLELLGTVALDLPEDGNPLPDPGAMRDVMPNITSNVDIDVHYLEATTDGDELITFLNEDYVVTRGGITEQVVTEDTTGSSEGDWLTTGTEGIALEGGNGNDILIADHGETTLSGGAGDDTIEGVFSIRDISFWRIDGTEPAIVIDGGDGDDLIRTSNATVDAGAGNDTVNIYGGEARGGDGNDQLNARSDGVVTLFGGAGDDRLVVGGIGSEAFGGLGNDSLNVDTGATGYGGAGNDTLQLAEGSTAFGGEGDDLFTLVSSYNDEDGPATITGGEGADTISARVRDPYGAPEAVFLQVTDFDPSEDLLQIGSFNGATVDNVEVVQNLEDGVTDVRLTYAPNGTLDPGTAIIRINGISDITTDQIVIVN
ncbi:hypothetical protein [uncultured Tateyamaria sp.]|uniref:calcium-binding protein n=1 Tax=uncultured Tateyamaria sp. TaxID=455651 RepID=UPI0026056FC5|nr:hypothetical protein [uncultured Tateyamaria sp.]